MEKEHNPQPKASGEILKHLDLFSGIGGFSLAAQWVWQDEHEIVAFCEIDKFCQKVLRKNFGDMLIYDDIKQLDGTKFTGIDLLTGGFPCQPFSVAGLRKGNEDDRALWPEMLRIIQEVKPRWIIGENVAGFVNMALDQSITDLENEGYEVQTFIIPACGKNAVHRRDRCWIVANRRCEYGEGQAIGYEHEETDRQRSAIELERPITRDGDRIISNPQSGSDRLDTTKFEGRENDTGRFEQVDTNSNIKRLQTDGRELFATKTEQFVCNAFGNTKGERQSTRDTGTEKFSTQIGQGLYGGAGIGWSENWYEVATRFCRVDDGVPNRVDRLKSLGNAIVPQVVYEIMKCIKEINDTLTTLP